MKWLCSAFFALALAFTPARATTDIVLDEAGHTCDTTITTGGTAQNLLCGLSSAPTPLNGYSVSNPNASDVCWVSDSATAAANASGSHIVAAGGGEYRTPLGYRPQGPVSVVCPNTADKITAEQW